MSSGILELIDKLTEALHDLEKVELDANHSEDGSLTEHERERLGSAVDATREVLLELERKANPNYSE